MSMDAYHDDERTCDHGTSLDLDCDLCEERIREEIIQDAEHIDYGDSLWPT